MDPPSRLELAKLVVAFMRSTNLDGVHRGFNASFKRTAVEIIRKPPNQDWLLALLATMNPAADIFRKDYVKPKAQRFFDADEGDDDWWTTSKATLMVFPWLEKLPRRPTQFASETVPPLKGRS